jgi:(p)ppGpp synthase/HD superfamily hydrolase
MSLLLKKALDQAVVWHRAQLRKYPGVEVPYASHLAGVAILLARHGFDDEVVAAGALHDCVEDAGVSYEELTALFGARVTELVRACTEQDRSLPWVERKRRYLEAFPHKPWEAQAITLADKIDNLESILICARDFGDPWGQFKQGRDAQLARYDALAGLLAALPPHPLGALYRERLEEVRALGQPDPRPTRS